MIPGSSGPLVKMLILAFAKVDRRIAVPIPFEVMYNPTSLSKTYEAEYHCRQQAGDANSTQIFNRIKPQQYTFEFVFDGTGASPPGGVANLTAAEPVQIKVQRFLAICGTYIGEIHRPNYLKLIWGTALIEDCVLLKADVNYTLFSAQGIPLRAKVNATFKENKDENLSLRILSPFSPDLTHQREVEAEDNLSNLSFEVYDDVAYYLQVARHNKLKNFRRLKQGQQLGFPPIKDPSA